MTEPQTISADYTLRPSELAETLAVLIEARQPCMVWGPPGCGKSQVANQTADRLGYEYMDVRGPLLDPVDLRGIPWRDQDGRTRWAPPAFLPPTCSTALHLVNLEELVSSVPMVMVSLFQLCLERKIGEYALPPGAAVIACGNREQDRSIVHRMPAPLANRFVPLVVHDAGGLQRFLDVGVDDLEGVGVSVVDAALFRRERVFEDVDLDAVVGEHARLVEAERLEIARDDFHGGDPACFHLLDKRNAVLEGRVDRGPQAVPVR